MNLCRRMLAEGLELHPQWTRYNKLREKVLLPNQTEQQKPLLMSRPALGCLPLLRLLAGVHWHQLRATRTVSLSRPWHAGWHRTISSTIGRFAAQDPMGELLSWISKQP